MMRKHGAAWTIVLSCAALLFTGRPALGQEKKALTLKFGLSERIRNEYHNNITDMSRYKNDRNDYFRIRTSVWAQVQAGAMATVYAKLTNEFRKYLADPKERDFTFDEIFVDNLYLKLDAPGKKASLTVGRQNLMYGEGFILMDGSPWDGSRSIYHDAVKLSVTAGKTTVDVLAIDNTKIEDRLPVIRGADLSDGKLKAQTPDQWMNDGAEKAIGLYAATEALPKAKIEAYALRKTEKPEPWINRGSPADELSLTTLGGRVSASPSARLGLTAEAALQTGSQGAIDHKAFGGYAYVTWTVEPQTKAAFSLGAIALSGDDPATTDNEGWNPVFSRWPKWSELYIYAHQNEVVRGSVRVAYWTNLFAPYVGYTAKLSDRLTIVANTFFLNAMESRTLPGGKRSGTARGREVQVWLKQVVNKNLSGHLLFDFLLPGDYYALPRTPGPFMRGELLITL